MNRSFHEETSINQMARVENARQIPTDCLNVFFVVNIWYAVCSGSFHYIRIKNCFMSRAILTSLILFTFYIQAFGQDALSITKQMFDKVKSINTVQYTFDSRERIKGNMYHEKSDFKVSVSPFKMYMKQSIPKKGVECLYVTGLNDGKAWVNPNAFPWITLSLDPYGSLMLNNHHHSIFDAGYAYTFGIIEGLFRKYQSQISTMVSTNGLYKVSGVSCYSLIFTNPNYKLVAYTTGANETPISIASKLNINYYSVIENNPDLSATDKIKQGTKIMVPNDYASKLEIYVSKDGMYPVYLKIYDLKGLYEEYTFTNVVINSGISANDFSKDNPAYGF